MPVEGEGVLKDTALCFGKMDEMDGWWDEDRVVGCQERNVGKILQKLLNT